MLTVQNISLSGFPTPMFNGFQGKVSFDIVKQVGEGQVLIGSKKDMEFALDSDVKLFEVFPKAMEAAQAFINTNLND